MEFSKWWTTEFKTIKFPSAGTVFDYCIDPETHKFVPWLEKVPQFMFDPDMPLQVRDVCIVLKFSFFISFRFVFLMEL